MPIARPLAAPSAVVITVEVELPVAGRLTVATAPAVTTEVNPAEAGTPAVAAPAIETMALVDPVDGTLIAPTAVDVPVLVWTAEPLNVPPPLHPAAPTVVMVEVCAPVAASPKDEDVTVVVVDPVPLTRVRPTARMVIVAVVTAVTKTTTVPVARTVTADVCVPVPAMLTVTDAGLVMAVEVCKPLAGTVIVPKAMALMEVD